MCGRVLDFVPFKTSLENLKTSLSLFVLARMFEKSWNLLRVYQRVQSCITSHLPERLELTTERLLLRELDDWEILTIGRT